MVPHGAAGAKGPQLACRVSGGKPGLEGGEGWGGGRRLSDSVHYEAHYPYSTLHLAALEVQGKGGIVGFRVCG
jgi:hypothetical protein